ncbi:GDP-mannose 4,6-dehydratase [Candidatus Pelagibacter sp.]|nr:GDP-mannose 4,6-dehydratase [Candidatus Pelagibacter sp.]
MKILITGVAGFIGFSFAEYLLKNSNKLKVHGIDNMDDYYSVKLKKRRLQLLKKYKNFSFKKIDITDKKKIQKYINLNKFNKIFHFAAQAGVRYCLENPLKYIKVNIFGFLNIIQAVRDNKIKKFFYASSSSVYGEVEKFPIKEDTNLNPKNIYGNTKKINEFIAKYYFKNFKVSSVGLRFFTIYGKWGRPDMLLIKLLQSQKKNKSIYLNNKGNHYRDFTSINNVNIILNKLMRKNIYGSQVFNICSGKPIFILDIIKLIEKKAGNIKKIATVKNPADVYKTHGCNKKILNYLKLKKIDVKYEKNIISLINWFYQKKIYKFL